MYSINSYALYNFVNDLLAQHPNVSIQRITLIVRKRDNESQRDLEALNQVIQNWHNLVTQKRILSLKIIATPHDINHYYSIFDSDSMFCGLVFHEDGLPSSTNVDYNPLFYTKESSIGQEMIKKYRTHFEHTMKRYEQKYLLYDSEKQEMGTNLRESAVI